MKDVAEGAFAFKVGKALAQQAEGTKKLAEFEAAAAEATVASSHCGRNRTLPVDLAGSGPLAGLKRPLGGLKPPLGGLNARTAQAGRVPLQKAAGTASESQVAGLGDSVGALRSPQRRARSQVPPWRTPWKASRSARPWRSRPMA